MLTDAALSHVKQCGIIDLAHSGAVGAFHVVSIDFKHGLGVHTRTVGCRQILVSHLRGRLLCPVLH